MIFVSKLVSSPEPIFQSLSKKNNTMIRFIILFTISLFLASCNSSVYFQLFKAVPENGTIIQNKILFEDNNCIVSYNLWSQGGKMGYWIYNKTKSDLSIDLRKTFFVSNGVAYDYYQNQSITRSYSIAEANSYSRYPAYYNIGRVATSASDSRGSSYSNTIFEKPEIIVPPGCSRFFSVFSIVDGYFNHCELPDAPAPKKIKILRFEKGSSPYTFYNIISYKTGQDSGRIENKFFVSEISNIPSKKMYSSIDTNACGEKLMMPKSVFKSRGPDHFYYEYIIKP